MRTLPVLFVPSLLLCATPALTAPVRVAVSLPGSYSSAAKLEAQLDDSTAFDFDATLVAPLDVTTVDDLADYDVFIFGDSGGSDSVQYTTAFLGVLEEFNAAGGAVIATSWASYVGPPELDPLLPIDQPNRDRGYCTGPTTITPVDTDHPLLGGITAFVDTTNYTETPGPLEAGATMLVSASCNGASVVTVAEPDGAGRQVYIGLLLTANEGNYQTAGLRSGMADQLVEQAVWWAAGCGDADDDGVDICNSDCDDDDAARFPGNTEICDGIDNDCDDVVPDDELDGDVDGVATCEGDCDDDDAARFPGNAEICDDIDNDCNDMVDDGLTTVTVYPDVDDDGYGDETAGFETCDATEGIADGTDCDDSNAAVFPGAEEVKGNDIDEDCDGEDLRGCGCASAPTPRAMWLAAVLLPLVVRRRR